MHQRFTKLLFAICFTLAIVCKLATAQQPVYPLGDEKNCSSLYAPRPFIESAEKQSIQPIKLKEGPHLFLDDYLIERSSNITREVVQPKRDPSISNPVVTSEGGDQCVGPYMAVLRDPDTKEFRLWYHGFTDGHIGKYATMTSSDGIHWNRPAKLLKDPGPLKWGCSVIDRGKEFDNPAERYLLAWCTTKKEKLAKDQERAVGLMMATSSDGLDWNLKTPKPALLHHRDINSLFYDPIRKQYIYLLGADLRDSTKWETFRRATMQMTSTDLTNWSKPAIVLTPEPNIDFGDTQFYGLEGLLVRGDLIIGTVKVLRDELKAKDSAEGSFGVGYSTLAWTRDGIHWVRDPAPFLEPDPTPGTWDHAHAWIDEQVLVDDSLLVYYGGYRNGHKMNRTIDRQIGVIKLPRDRYVARTAGSTTGTLRTPPVIVEGYSLSINADLKGDLKVRAIDETGKAIPGFDFTDCQPLRGDSCNHVVKWNKPLNELAAKVVQLELRWNDGKLYGMTLEKNEARSK